MTDLETSIIKNAYLSNGRKWDRFFCDPAIVKLRETREENHIKNHIKLLIKERVIEPLVERKRKIQKQKKTTEQPDSALKSTTGADTLSMDTPKNETVQSEQIQPEPSQESSVTDMETMTKTLAVPATGNVEDYKQNVRRMLQAMIVLIG